MTEESFGAREQNLHLSSEFSLALLLLIFQIVLFAESTPAQEIREQRGGGCATQYYWEQVKDQVEIYDMSLACPTYGPCDLPEVRGEHLGDSRLPVHVIRRHFHIMREDDGSNPAV